jgi:ankyrin repeat protein
MKLVREHIDEKFIEDSDPIDDLGIGAIHIVNRYIKDVLHINIEKYKFSTTTGYDAILCRLAKDDNIKIISLLLTLEKVNVSASNNLALRWAAANGNIDMIKLLMKYGADPNEGDTVLGLDVVTNSLDCAVMYDQKETIKYLLKIGTKVTENVISEIKIHFKNDPSFIKEVEKYRKIK